MASAAARGLGIDGLDVVPVMLPPQAFERNHRSAPGQDAVPGAGTPIGLGNGIRLAQAHASGVSARPVPPWPRRRGGPRAAERPGRWRPRWWRARPGRRR
jgi:hypothetical protein